MLVKKKGKYMYVLELITDQLITKNKLVNDERERERENSVPCRIAHLNIIVRIVGQVLI